MQPLKGDSNPKSMKNAFKFLQCQPKIVLPLHKHSLYQGIYQLSESGEARLQIMLKVGGQNQKSMASISDFGQNLAKVGGQ